MTISKAKVIIAIALTWGLFTALTAQASEVANLSGLKPMAEPAPLPAGVTSVGVTQHGVAKRKVVSIDGSVITYKDADGCTVVEDRKRGYFAPEVSGTNCGIPPYRIDVHSKEGNIWPLAVGKTESYSATFRAKEDFSSSRACKVTKEVRIKTHTGLHDTFKVVCAGKWTVYTYYMSPKLGGLVKLVRAKGNKHSLTKPLTWEFTRLE